MGAGADAMSDETRPPTDILDSEIEPPAYDSDKPPEAIEEDIARTRADLSETLDALERKLAPRQLLEKGVDMLRDSMDGNMGPVGEALRANPIPLALIGVGIGWLLLSQTGGARIVGDATRSARQSLGRGASGVADRASEMASGIAARAGDMAEKVGDLASDAVGRVKGLVGAEETNRTETYPAGQGDYAYARPKMERGEAGLAAYGAEARSRVGQAAETARDAAERARATVGSAAEQASAYADYAGEQIDRARDRLSRLMDDHPLAIGALGVLAGAVLAMALPSTRMENRALGETRDRMLDEAKGLGREAIDRARDIAGTATEAAVEAARGEIEKSEPNAQSDKPDKADKPSRLPGSKPGSVGAV
jgi:hypothetical protein